MNATNALSLPTNLADLKAAPAEYASVTDAGTSTQEPAKLLIDDAEIIRVANITKRVATSDGVLTIVNNANFSVLRGEAVAVVGASGSGKSTLLGLMAGLDTPTEGDIAINGESLFKLDEDGRAKLRGRLVGFVFQSFQLLPSLTALENVMLPLELAGAADAESRARVILDRVGLKDRVKHYPKQLSGGEQQRVAIARAFVTEPKLLFADEPTGNLDAKTGRRMIELLFELNQERGTTLILVTHDAGLASRCGRRLTIDAGVVTDEADQDTIARS
ncbi:MAG: ABC transporter ATP-binding protein [Rhodocyclaceae bacterium]|nr:ABC transporter ATP-binding protein [Rhodocyclaceae bacterium]